MTTVMTKRHFELIAQSLRDTQQPLMGWTREEIATGNIQWERDVSHMATALSSTNPNFNRDKFLAACGVEE